MLTFKPRILILPLAAFMIAGMVWFKSNQPQQELSPAVSQANLQRRAAPTFTLYDQRSRPFQLARYLGRHKLLIVFFDPSGGVAGNAQLQILKEGFAQLTAHGEKVIAISSATPYAVRESFKAGGGEFPFHVLSDADFGVQTQWGCMTAGDPPQAKPAVFVVDRASVIAWSQVGGESPIPLETLLNELRKAR